VVKKYTGLRLESGCVVQVDGKELNPRWDLRNHSPDGFEWGYGGSGPAQLALALLADVLQDDDIAEEWYQQFKWHVVARLYKDQWVMSEAEILDLLARIREVPT
jgi:Family of unknown function (DUF6166)